MKPRRALIPGADPEQEMPSGASNRLDRIQVALATLRDEERRLSRLGFEGPLKRCRQERRYWEFLEALFSLAPAGDEPGPGSEARSWRDLRTR